MPSDENIYRKVYFCIFILCWLRCLASSNSDFGIHFYSKFQLTLLLNINYSFHITESLNIRTSWTTFELHLRPSYSIYRTYRTSPVRITRWWLCGKGEGGRAGVSLMSLLLSYHYTVIVTYLCSIAQKIEPDYDNLIIAPGYGADQHEPSFRQPLQS